MDFQFASHAVTHMVQVHSDPLPARKLKGGDEITITRYNNDDLDQRSQG